MRIALIQQPAEHDRRANLEKGLAALERAAAQGANLACFAELAFERFHPQKRAESGFEQLAEPIPGPSLRHSPPEPANSASWWCSISTNVTAIDALIRRR